MSDEKAPSKPKKTAPSKVKTASKAAPSKETLKEDRKAAEMQAMLQDRIDTAKGWTPEQAAKQAGRDLADFKNSAEQGSIPDKSEHGFIQTDMAVRADASPAYKAALANLERNQEQGEKAGYEPKRIGSATFQLKDVPSVTMDAAKQRFGRPGLEMQVAAARENGTYKGEVLAGQDVLAQKVGDNSVVFHKKEAIELVSEKHLQNPNRVNGSQMAIHYTGAAAKAYPYDPQRENLDIMVNTMKKQAEKLGLPDREKFAQTLDKVKEGMWTEMVQRREAQTHQRQEQRDRPQQEQQRSQERER